MKHWNRLIIAGTTLATLGCTDEPVSPARPLPALTTQTADAASWFIRYVSVGTSVSGGFASEGLHLASQQFAWPLQLARMAGVTQSQPWISRPGCRSPFATPLASFVRESGESVAIALHLASCAPNEPGVVLPAGNVAVPGARASHALFATPESQPPTDANTKIYARILPSNTTQVQAMLAQHPTFVSVELGINEVLSARGGSVAPGQLEKPAVFARNYDEVLARVRSARPQGVVLVGLVSDLSNVPAFRTGSEIYADRGAFLAAFHVDVNADCNGSPNLITVPLRVPVAVATGVTLRNAGQPPFSFSCSDKGSTVADGVLTPAEVRIVRDVMGGINSHIRQRAAAYGYAYFELDALYGMATLKPPFSVVALMTTANPYGTYVSLDGFHPSATGQTVLANAAAKAIDARYALGLGNAVMARASAQMSR